MARKVSRKIVERREARSHQGIGSEFFHAAELAAGHDYWNAAGLLFVHASIAYADALCIKYAAWKSTSDNHMDAIALLEESTTRLENSKQASSHLMRIVREKNRLAYTGQSFHRDEVEAIRKHAERFREWAEELLR
ncbi:MAG: hypothetical protein HYY16_08865 [Planctomycetes bacterium]|nr:hypothetical protein [Planctomycetota bacterium]